MSTPVTVISNQNSAEYERMRVENEKWKARFMQFLTSIQASFWNLESIEDEQVNFRCP